MDALQDVWGSKAQQPLDEPEAIGPGYLRVQVSDACGRVDINAADFVTLSRLTGDADLAQAIMDWRGVGQEAEYYRNLPYPYMPRHGRFETTGELLLVKGMTPDVYYGSSGHPGLKDLTTVASTSLNTMADGQPRIGLNGLPGSDLWSVGWAQGMVNKYGGALTVNDLHSIILARDLLPNRRYTSLSQLAGALGSYQPEDLARIVDYFSVTSSPTTSGKVNVNTAPVEVLAALPGSSTAFANAIAQERDTAPFTSLGAVAQIMLSAGGPATFMQMIDSVTTKSSCFVIDSMGYTGAGRGFRRLCALVSRTKNQVTILYQREENVPLPPPEQDIVVASYSRRLHRALS